MNVKAIRITAAAGLGKNGVRRGKGMHTDSRGIENALAEEIERAVSRRCAKDSISAGLKAEASSHRSRPATDTA